MIISLVAAASDNNVIGNNGQLPWKMPSDMKFFKDLTMGHVVIMGRKTYESMGKPLQGRKNIVVTRNKSFKAEGCIVLSSLIEAFNVFTDEKEVFVIGGAQVYMQAMQKAHKIYLTRVHCTVEGDAHFVQPSEKEWVQTKYEKHLADTKNPYSYTFIELVRKNL